MPIDLSQDFLIVNQTQKYAGFFPRKRSFI